MKRIRSLAAVAVLASMVLGACTPHDIPVIHVQEAEPGKNALLIQADFAGLVMTGVAHSVSKDLDVYNVRPLIPL